MRFDDVAKKQGKAAKTLVTAVIILTERVTGFDEEKIESKNKHLADFIRRDLLKFQSNLRKGELIVEDKEGTVPSDELELKSRRKPQLSGSVEDRFRRLADIWYRETWMLFSTPQKAQHQAYKEIISLGEAAIPLILSELSESRNDWFLALIALTGQDAARGAKTIPDAVDSWLQWGVHQGYIKTKLHKKG